MNISAWAVKRPIPVIVLFFLLSIAGLFAFKKLQVQNFPNMDFPAISVAVSLPGATSSQLETQITRKLEDNLANIEEVKHIHSSISQGVSMTILEFNLEKKVQEAADEVKDAVDKIKGQFPAGTNEPLISKLTIANEPILTYQIKAPLDAFDLSWFIDNDLNKLLLSIAGVGKITRQGGVEREIQVIVEPTRLMALDTTIDAISNQLHSVRQDFSGGRTHIGGFEQSIRQVQDISNATDLANLQIPLNNHTYLRLNNVAHVVDTAAQSRQMAFLNGEKTTTIQVYPAKNASELAVATKVRESLKGFLIKHPNFSITEINNTIHPIQTNYKGSMHSLFEGCILAILVVWIFLRDRNATLISAVALPLSIIPTFLCIYWLGFTLNTVSLLSITLVIGILVDDAIVEVENIARHIKERSISPWQAAIDATQEIGTAVIATSFTLIAVFLPTAYMGGVIGRIFKQFGWTAAIAILFSLLVARLVTPMLAAYFMRPYEKNEPVDSFIMRRYVAIVHWCLAHRAKTIFYAIGFFLLSIFSLFFIQTTFVPPQDVGQITINAEVPPGSDIQAIQQVLRQAYVKTQTLKEIKNVYATIGNGVQGGQEASDSSITSGKLTFKLVDSSQRQRSQTDLENIILQNLKSIAGAKFSMSLGNGGRYSFVLAGNDSTLLKNTAHEVEKQIRTIPHLGGISSDYNVTQPELVIKPNFNRAAELGVLPFNIGQVIRVATSGDYSSNLAKIDLPDRQIPVRVMVAKSAIQSLVHLKELRISSNEGSVPLGNVAEVSLSDGPVSISRYDRMRSISFAIDLQGQNIGAVHQKIEALPIMKHLPNGIYKIPADDVERIQEMFSGFLLAMGSGILCVYLVLVLLFNDFRQPLTILAALPLAISGALLSLVLFGYSFSMSSLIGILMLMGIVTKNSILLVDYILLSQRQGNPRQQAIIDACKKRARPIVMTTIAMIAGMLPIAFGISSDSSFKSSMAVTVIGGLITSTALSLILIPVVFDLIATMKLKWEQSTRI